MNWLNWIIDMKTYKYQLHAHTLPCSACAKMTPEELVEGLHEGGYQGCVITNHFIGGNTGIDRTLSWNEFVKQYVDDYMECCRYAEKYDLDIIFGIEEVVVAALEILCYGVTPEMLYNHPELASAGPKEWYEIMHSYGVLCIQAHPFRERDYIPKAQMLPLDCIDGIEVYNACNNEKNNGEAEMEAAEHPEFILVSGADAHRKNEVCCGGIEITKRIRNGEGLVGVLKSGKYRLIKE